MKYKGEVLLYGEIISETMMNATHPSQVARNMVRRMKMNNPDMDKFMMYVANENGEVWMYVAKKQNGKYEVHPLTKTFAPLNRDEIDMVFTMNVPIKNTVIQS